MGRSSRDRVVVGSRQKHLEVLHRLAGGQRWDTVVAADILGTADRKLAGVATGGTPIARDALHSLW